MRLQKDFSSVFFVGATWYTYSLNSAFCVHFVTVRKSVHHPSRPPLIFEPNLLSNVLKFLAELRGYTCDDTNLRKIQDDALTRCINLYNTTASTLTEWQNNNENIPVDDVILTTFT